MFAALIARVRKQGNAFWLGGALLAGGAVVALLRKKKKALAPPPRPLKPTEVVGKQPDGQPAFVCSPDGELLRGVAREGAAAAAPETTPALLERLAENATRAIAWEAAPADGAPALGR